MIADDLEDGQEGHGQERTRDAPEEEPEEEAHEDDHRVQGETATQDQGGDEVAFEEAHHQVDRGHRQGVAHVVEDRSAARPRTPIPTIAPR